MTLSEYIQTKIQYPFEWGHNDCMTFTVGWIEERTGKKYLPSLIWKNKTQALRRIKKEGGLESSFDKNFERININYCSDGDICVIGNTAGIISGRNILTIEEKKGFIYLPRTLATNAWTVK